ncbi:hypothetical protein NESM_000025800 [Novymonas esmeraldas]|uniref:Uncharacterized protein n=1 Tax=Novymonas esmeraldas TaxID=1808958 RepID=A0AAW0F2E1_9TRYP
MADGYHGDAYHIVMRQSQAAETVLPIPSFCKPLAASVRSFGGGEAGVLASYFDPEQHAWVVRQLPVHEAWPHQPPPTLVIRVATVVDPTNLYELHVSLSSAVDEVENDELYALQRRSQLYGLLAAEHLSDKSGHTLRAAAAEGQLPQLAEAVTLAAPLDVMGGFVLTGGGFLSDFPVLRDGPALPRSMDAVYDDILAGDDFCGPPLPTGDTGGVRARAAGSASASGGASSASPVSASEALEYTAWSVTAAANAGLACQSIGLRRRSPLEWSRLQSQSSPSSFLQERQDSLATVAESALPVAVRAHSSYVSGCGALAAAQDPTGLVSSARPSGHTTASWLAGDSLASPAVPNTRPLLETLTLRGEVGVTLSRREGEEWRITLPPPHGSLSFAMGPNRELMATTRRVFYCD